MMAAMVKVLREDYTLNLIAQDRIYSAMDVGELSKSRIPDAWDDRGQLLPCILIKNINQARLLQYTDGHTDLIQLHLYEKWGYHNITKMRTRVRELLHETKLQPIVDVGNCWRVLLDSETRQVEDQALSVSLEIMNFRILWRRTNIEQRI